MPSTGQVPAQFAAVLAVRAGCGSSPAVSRMKDHDAPTAQKPRQTASVAPISDSKDCRGEVRPRLQLPILTASAPKTRHPKKFSPPPSIRRKPGWHPLSDSCRPKRGKFDVVDISSFAAVARRGRGRGGGGGRQEKRFLGFSTGYDNLTRRCNSLIANDVSLLPLPIVCSQRLAT